MLISNFICFGQSTTEENTLKTVQMYCAACHKAPEPADLPKDLWKKNVLPEMGSYYGVKTNGFGLLKKRKPEELEAIISLNIYPETQQISDSTWQSIKNYYINNAPETISNAKERKNRTKNLKDFKRVDIDLLGLPESLITSLVYNEAKNELWIGEDRSRAFSWSLKSGSANNSFTSSVVSHIVIKPETKYFLEMGSLKPSELKKGSVSMTSDDGNITLIENLHRPVYMNVEDLNEDGKPEIIVCNYGSKTGSFEIFEQVGGNFENLFVHEQAGAIKSLVHDMNNDGKEDIVVMFSQGNESIFIFYQQEDLKFETSKILSFNPLYGSNDFIMVDYEGDGDMDIIVAQGDNADITVGEKPYHGIRIFINTNNNFKERFFYPLYGATKVIAHDFDKDGDMDLAATAFYQDYTTLAHEGFVYLENMDSENFLFQSYALKNSDPIKSYTLEKADIDQDGDMDIVFGLFSWSITPVPPLLKTLWQSATYDMTVLFNKQE
jgi:hypothetical protein